MFDETISKFLKISKTADKQKVEKLSNLKEMGVNPYPYTFKRTISAEELKKKYANLEVGEKKESDVYSIAGRLMLRRKMGKVLFMDLSDRFEKIQVYVPKLELTELENSILSNIDIGDFIGVEGFVFKTQTGEITIHCKKIELLSKSVALLPEKYHGLADTELKYRNRFIDLIMNPESVETFKKRSIIITEIRNFLNARGFMEVETPVLQPIYGGANANPFSTHHNDLDMELFLRISPELYLKRLITGGIDKVYEICKNFRNEGIDTTHNPEFTMIEWYEAYTDYIYQMEQVETLIETLVKKVNNGDTKLKFKDMEIDFKTPWRRLTVYDGLREYAKVDPLTISKDDIIKELKKYKKDIEERKSRGELLMELFEETVEDKLIQPTFVIDHPVEISPLTKPHRKEKGLVERFEAYVGKMEISNTYTELNDPVDQTLRLKEQEEHREFDSESQRMDENFLYAVETGLPPLGGVGIGIDRIVLLLTGNESIRDIIFFPTMKPKKNN